MVCYSVFIIWDTTNSSSDTPALISNLTTYIRPLQIAIKQGNTLQLSYVDEFTYTGTDISKYNLVLHLHQHSNTSQAIPAAGQAAIQNWVNNGGTYVGTSWLSYAGSFSNHSSMSNLLLFQQFSSVGNGYSASFAIDVRDLIEVAGGTSSLTAFEQKLLSGYSATNHGSRFTDSNIIAGATSVLDVAEIGGTTQRESYLVTKTYGKGRVFNFNDSFDLFGNNGNHKNSPLFAAILVDELFINIVINTDIDLMGDHCYYICFLAGTLVSTDQGDIKIDELVPGKNTINRNPILHVTETVTNDKYLVEISKNALGNNVPNKKLVISKNHLVEIGGVPMEAKSLLHFNGVRKIAYNKEKLYNILMDKHYFIKVQNTSVETLNPENIYAKLVNSKIKEEIKDELFVELSQATRKNNYNKIEKAKNLKGKFSVLKDNKRVNINRQSLLLLNSKKN